VGHSGRLEREDGWSQSAGGIASRSRLYLSTSKFSSDTCVTLLASRFHRIRVQKGHTSQMKIASKAETTFPYLPKSMLKNSPGRLDSPKEDSVMCVTFSWHYVVQFQTSHRDTSAK
jgi:hypothetical protein